MIRKISIGTILLSISSIVLSAPVHLDCAISVEKEQIHFSVKLDESNERITHITTSGGLDFNTEGFFTANMITYKGVSVGLTTTFYYSINRSTLAFRETVKTRFADPSKAGKMSVISSENDGVCNIAKVTGRKI